MTKKFVWFGFFVGSTIGGFLPALWGGDLFSIPAFGLSIAAGFIGMWAGYRIGESL